MLHFPVGVSSISCSGRFPRCGFHAAVLLLRALVAYPVRCMSCCCSGVLFLFYFPHGCVLDVVCFGCSVLAFHLSAHAGNLQNGIPILLFGGCIPLCLYLPRRRASYLFPLVGLSFLFLPGLRMVLVGFFASIMRLPLLFRFLHIWFFLVLIFPTPVICDSSDARAFFV